MSMSMGKPNIKCKSLNDTTICKCYTCRENVADKNSHACNPLCKWKPEGDKHLRCKLCGQVLPIEEVSRLEECPAIVGARGLGDVVAKAAKAIGLKQSKDCGCGSKQNKLNHLVPFKKDK